MKTSRSDLLHLLACKSFRLGEFKLSSGASSDYYIDCRTTTLTGEGGRLTGLAVLDLIRQHELRARAVGGLTLGADPIVCNVAAASAWSPTLYWPLSNHYIHSKRTNNSTKVRERK